MKKIMLIYILSCTISAHIASQNTQMHIVGSVVMGNSEEASPTPGTIRWTGLDFEAFNGLRWVTLTGGKTAPATDVDGNIYPTLKIGDQIWFQENLRTSKYRDGSNIPLVTDNTQWGGLSTGAYCWYENNNVYDQPQGKMYNGYTVMDSRGPCPEGWRVPTESDFEELALFLDGSATAGGKLKEIGTTTWQSPNTGATNSSNFTAVGNGTRYDDGSFPFASGFLAHFWTSDEGSSGKARIISLSSQLSSIFFSEVSVGNGNHIRCMK